MLSFFVGKRGRMQILSGKEPAQKLKEAVANEIRKTGVKACLAVVLVGEDPASEIYVRNKIKTCSDLGIGSKLLRFSSDISESKLLEEIQKMNKDISIHGILVQLPLPKSINENKILEQILPIKDVDCLGSTNLGKLFKGQYQIAPCTPAGILYLLDYYKLDVSDKNVVVLGRSNIVGKPLAQLLLHRNANVSICHSKTSRPQEICKRADFLFVATGVKKLVDKSYLKPSCVIIDVGIHRDDTGLCGDVDFEQAKSIASAISPVPGGVGPMTIAMLMNNCLQLAKLQC